MNNKNTVTIIMVVTLIITIIGGTLAYWTWQSTTAQKTNVTFTVASGFTCGADGGGDITSSQKQLAPAACTNPEYAIQRTVTVTTTQDAGKEIVLDMWLKVNSIGSGLSGTHNFKYALTTNASSCTTDVIAEGDFYGANTTNNSEFKLLDGKQYSQSTPQAGDVYYLYIWLDAAELSQATQGQTFDMTLEGSCTDELSEETNDAFDDIYLVSTTNNYTGEALADQLAPTGVAVRTNPITAMSDWQYITGVANDTKPFYLKYKVENGVITESYVEFVIDAALKTQLTTACNGDSECEASVAALPEDTFILKGKTINDDLDSSADSPYYLANAKEIYRAFGTNCSANPNDANFSSSDFDCSVAGLHADVNAIGYIDVDTDNISCCIIYSNGTSYCG